MSKTSNVSSGCENIHGKILELLKLAKIKRHWDCLKSNHDIHVKKGVLTVLVVCFQ